MMTLVMEGALDLSSKSVNDDNSKANSPVPSLNSDDECLPADRSVSVSSEADSHSGRLSAPPSSDATATSDNQGTYPSSPRGGRASAGSLPHPGSPGDVSPTNRPFKSYPFEPLPGIFSQMATANAGMAAYGFGVNPNSVPFNLFDSAISMSSPIGQYLQQRKRRAEPRQQHIESLNDCQSVPPPEKLSKASTGETMPDEQKDNSYWERRRKNNEAAKRSRDARRAKEEEIALRAAFLEQENLKLRAQVAILKNETAKLHYMLYNRM